MAWSRNMMRTGILTAGGLLLLAAAACAHPPKHTQPTHAASDPHEGHQAHAAPVHEATPGDGSPAPNPVQAEMQLLSAAMISAVTSIGQGDVRPIRHALHQVHRARANTEAAIHDGSYKPPQHADNMSRFMELDEAFHTQLERLAAASAANDVPNAAEALGAALQACNGCHSEFRLPAQ
jgi:Cytochrome C'